MRLLIDTATKHLVVALVNENNIVDIVVKEGKNDHSKTLMVEISEMMARQNLAPKELSSIVVGEGPGSYTGVRIGVTVAKTMSFLLNIPLYKISTLLLLTSQVNDDKVAAMIDARRGMVFGTVYDFKNNSYIVEPKLRSEDEMATQKGDAITVKEFTENIDVTKLNFEKVEDIHTFSPNYLREWGE